MDDPFLPCRDALRGRRFLLASVVPFRVDSTGTVWLDSLWHRDLMAHLRYMSDLTVLAPALRFEPGADLVAVGPETAASLRFRALPEAGSLAAALRTLPRVMNVAQDEVRRADIVQSGVAGWPLPLGLVVNPLAALLRRPLIVNIESAFWRPSGPGPHGGRARLRAALTEALATWSVRRARLAMFTHSGYRDQLAGDRGVETIVAPASWISESDILTEDAAAKAWSDKPAAVRFVMAARLVPEKGVPLLLQALAAADAAGTALEVDILGEGPLRADAERLAAGMRHVRLRVLNPVPYGHGFLEVLRGYHAVLVPSVSDEQPRILFDAFSQALPVLASDTPGHRDTVRDGVTGCLFVPGDAEALRRSLARAAQEGDALARMGQAALEAARAQTHKGMHLLRARRYAALFGRPADPG